MSDDLRSTALAISDLRDVAQRHLPRGIFEYVARGTDEDRAVSRNAQAFDEVLLQPRVVRDVSGTSPAMNLLGLPSAAPIAIAPTGFASLLWLDGEVASARAAAAAGVPFTLSTGSITPMERIREESDGRLWLQLYVWPQRRMTMELIERAQAARFETLVITVDTPAAPFRPYNLRNGFSIPFKVSRRNAFDIALHPRWLFNVVLRNYLRNGPMVAENYPKELRTPVSKAAVGKFNLPFADDVTWEDIRDMRRRWKGPVLLKGVLSADDADQAVRAGCDGVIVSNHGGRNLDSSIAPLRVLPEIADRIGHKATVLLDSGVTRGSDIAKALALGADGVLTGKATLFGVGAAGEAGAKRALDILVDELTRVMTFVGARDVGALTPDLLRIPHDFSRVTPPAAAGSRDTGPGLRAAV